MRRIYVICFITINIIIFPLIACDNILNDGVKNQGIQKNLIIPFICSVEWKLLFEDDFDDGILKSDWNMVNPAQVSETNGYLQVNIDVTDNGGEAYLIFTDMSIYSSIKIEYKNLIHKGASCFYPRCTIWNWRYNIDPANNGDDCLHASIGYGDYSAYNSEGSGISFLLNEGEGLIIQNISNQERYDTWVTNEFIVHYKNGGLEYNNNLNESGILSGSGTSTYSNLTFTVRPQGWNTGHYMRIDDLKIYAR